MTAAEYRRLLAAGKIKPESEQKRKATKRRALETAAGPVERSAPAGSIRLVEVRIRHVGGEEIHWINPAFPELLAFWQGEAEKLNRNA